MIKSFPEETPERSYTVFLVFVNDKPSRPKAGRWEVAIYYRTDNGHYFYSRATDKRLYDVTHFTELPPLPEPK